MLFLPSLLLLLSNSIDITKLGKLIYSEPTYPSSLDSTEVHEYDNLRSLSFKNPEFLDNSVQSVVKMRNNNNADPMIISTEYLRTIIDVAMPTLTLLSATAPLKIAVLGMGGGTLPHYFSSHPSLENSVIDAVELSPTVAFAAINFLGLASVSNVHVHISDALDWLENSPPPSSLDAIFVDIFSSDPPNLTPPAFLSLDFLRLCSRKLKRTGYICHNVHNQQLSLAQQNYKIAFPNSAIEHSPASGNTVISLKFLN